MELGYKAQIVDNVNGFILDNSVEVGNPAHGLHLARAIDRIKQLTRNTPRAVYTTGGHRRPQLRRRRRLQGLEHLGLSYFAIPRTGKPSQARRQTEHRRAFHETLKRRTVPRPASAT